jgi:hypothetical protein
MIRTRTLSKVIFAHCRLPQDDSRFEEWLRRHVESVVLTANRPEDWDLFVYVHTAPELV